MKFKKALAAVLAVLMLFSLAACGKEKQPIPTETVLSIFVPNQAMEVMSTIVSYYKSYVPEVSIKITLDEGAILAAKMEAGYPCDLYIADAAYFADWLDGNADIEKNPNKNDLVHSRDFIFRGPANAEYAADGVILEKDATTTDFFAVVSKNSRYIAYVDAFLNYLKTNGFDDMLAEYNFSFDPEYQIPAAEEVQ